MPSIKGNGTTLTLSFYANIWGEIIVSLLPMKCPNCLIAAWVRCHITAEMFRKHRNEEIDEKLYQDIKSSKKFLKKVFLIVASDHGLHQCHMGMRITCPLFHISKSKFPIHLIKLYVSSQAKLNTTHLSPHKKKNTKKQK